MIGRPIILGTTCAAVALLAAPLTAKHAPILVWNASASAPIGLYFVRPIGAPVSATLVAVAPPKPLADELDRAGYLPRGTLLLKPILALPGQSVCRDGPTIIVDGIAVGVARDRDRRGNTLPAWQGCRVIAEGQVFLMNPDEPASLDGRYFGPIAASAIVGRAVPIWTLQPHDSEDSSARRSHESIPCDRPNPSPSRSLSPRTMRRGDDPTRSRSGGRTIRRRLNMPRFRSALNDQTARSTVSRAGPWIS